MTTKSDSVFLTAEWRYLAMLNYEIEPTVLVPFVPKGTELDSWNGRTFISVVGFLFQKTRVFSFPIPFHRNFEEVNLRFYVRRKVGDDWQRGVVFFKELVPRKAIAVIARAFYNENYVALPMCHSIKQCRGKMEKPISVEYSWRLNGAANFLKLATRGAAQLPSEGSEQEFITEHYWGYSAQRDGTTLEYRVEHPRWRVWDAGEAELHCDAADLYGQQFCNVLNRKPTSAFLAEGSAVSVYRGCCLSS